jgi:colanic acid/amylovoran biosynthesis glycosyltransferase
VSTHVASHVAYVVSRFPKVSETFIVDEILALERQGVTVSVYTLAAGRDEVVQPDAAELARRATVLGLTSPRWLFAQLYWLVRRPACVLDIWLRMVVEHLRAPRQLLRACVAIAHAAHFARCMQRDGVHHVHAHWATHTALTAWAIHRLNGIPYSFTAHADDIYVRRPMLEEKVQGADFVITISDYNRRFLAKQLGAEGVERVRVVHCGVASGSFRPAPLPQSNTPLVIACVARLEGKKGHVHLLDACAKLIRRGVALRCLLVGDGPERRAIEHQRDALGLNEHVTFLGAQPRSRVREVLVDANVVVLPGVVMPSGRADGIPVALMEAMAIQRPVVASAI